MSREDFDAIDTDGDGFITASELLTSLADKATAEEIATIVTMADADGDNKIDYDEYAKFAR